MTIELTRETIDSLTSQRTGYVCVRHLTVRMSFVAHQEDRCVILTKCGGLLAGYERLQMPLLICCQSDTVLLGRHHAPFSDQPYHTDARSPPTTLKTEFSINERVEYFEMGRWEH